LLTPGEPAGIGPDITIQIAQQSWPFELIAIADPDLLLQRAKEIGLPLKVIECGLQDTYSSHQPGTLKILPVKLKSFVHAGKLNTHHAEYVLETLTLAAKLCLEKKAQAVVTGPVHKGVMNAAGIPFTGHTEFFAAQSRVSHTVMLFVVNELKVALATTHLPLSEVPAHITQKNLRMTIEILIQGLKRQFNIASPNILVCGLNPHAGESGYLGKEEIEIITPLLNELRGQHYQLEGPLPADTIFTPKQLSRAHAVLAMYHDQALPLVKYLGFGHAVNVTLGLPFIRTSVDHGTALDAAGKGTADSGSLVAAIQLANKLSF
jgi:4-hydroxythreonine-4-phosphate dehydrogenase